MISYLVNGSALDALRAEEPHHGAAGPQHAHHLLRERLRGRRLEEVEDVPAQHAVDAAVGLREALRQRRRQPVARVGPRVLVDLGGEVLDVQLAAEMLAEERDVGADHRAEVDQHRRLVVRERADELRAAPSTG